MTATVGVSRICIGEAGVIAVQTAPQITDGTIPPGRSLVAEPEFHAVIAADRLNCLRTLRAEWRRIVVVNILVIGYHSRPVQHVREGCARIADVVTQVVGNRHVLDCLVEALARVPALKRPF